MREITAEATRRPQEDQPPCEFDGGEEEKGAEVGENSTGGGSIAERDGRGWVRGGGGEGGEVVGRERA